MENIEVKAESSYLNPAIDSKKKLIDWTMTMLGAPLVTVELNEVQFDAMDLFQKHKYLTKNKKQMRLDFPNYARYIVHNHKNRFQ